MSTLTKALWLSVGCVLGGVATTYAAASSDLTGAWKTETGMIHCLRQVGNEVFWYADDRPRVHNVFYGIRAGQYITGKWADLPGGQIRGYETLSLRIESPDRFVKISQTGPYLGSVWTRTEDSACACTSAGTIGAGQAGGIGTGSGNPPAVSLQCPCGLGQTWILDYQIGNYWRATLTRRGSSNVFDSVASTSAASGRGVCTIAIDGNDVTLRFTDTAGNNPSTWKGTVTGPIPCDDAPLCCAVNGTWAMDSNPGQVFQWKGRILCDVASLTGRGGGGGGGGGGGSTGIEGLPGANLPPTGGCEPPVSIPVATLPEPAVPTGATVCANQRTLPIMDYWLSRARPKQEPDEDLRFDCWGRIVGTSSSAVLTTAEPPTTSLTRCEWLWEMTEKSDTEISPETQRVLGPFREFVWNHIWRK